MNADNRTYSICVFCGGDLLGIDHEFTAEQCRRAHTDSALEKIRDSSNKGTGAALTPEECAALVSGPLNEGGFW